MLNMHVSYSIVSDIIAHAVYHLCIRFIEILLVLFNSTFSKTSIGHSLHTQQQAAPIVIGNTT